MAFSAFFIDPVSFRPASFFLILLLSPLSSLDVMLWWNVVGFFAFCGTGMSSISPASRAAIQNGYVVVATEEGLPLHNSSYFEPELDG